MVSCEPSATEKEASDLAGTTTERRRFVVHAGIHKTGSKSIQAFLEQFRTRLLEQGVGFYSGLYSSRNHVELHAAAMRIDRASPFKVRTGFVPDDAFCLRVRERIRNFVAASDRRSYVFSAEGLSYLRYEDEMERFRALFPDGDIQIVMYLRKPADFLKSYAAEMGKHPVAEPVDRDSFAYVGADSWLLDYEDRVERFRRAFEAANVTVIDYDDEVRRHGNVIPSFLRVLGVEGRFSSEDWSKFFLNRGTAS
jgi:hypothetical protein